jgi:hypothetical protein
MNYTNANAIVGALDCAGRELKRRVNDRFRRAQVHKLFSRLIASRDRFYEMKMVPYENSKIAENGDVYPADLVN